MKIKFAIPLLFLLYSFKVFSQDSVCGLDLYHQDMMLKDSAYRNQISFLEMQVQSFLKNKTENDRATLYTIPVVVHVIHLGEAVGTTTNISDAQIQGAIAGLNNRWRNTIGSGVDVEIEFCLATRDPNGNATTGINRVDGSGVALYSTQGIKLGGCSTGAVENDVKSLSRWPVLDYYNIWVVREICNGSWGGWTYYPNGSVNDGATIVRTSMTSSSTLLTHEVGHGFFAYHTFEGDGGDLYCPVDTNCLVNGDRVCDTPAHKEGDCGTTNPCAGGGIWFDSRYNYMSYCGSLNRFTQGQKDRMRAVTNVAPRVSLLTSLGCSSPVSVGEINGEKNIFSVVPNPSNGSFTLNAKYALPNCSIQIFNLIGEQIYSEEIKFSQNDFSKQINMDISAGIYFIKIISEDSIVHCEKIIIQ